MSNTLTKQRYYTK